MKKRTEWLKKSNWGVFCHYLAAPPSTHGDSMSSDNWNKQVDSFDVKRLAKQLSQVGASYFFITLGQGSGHYCAPNEKYDQITGITPSKCSERDLVAELYAELSKHDIALMLYSTSDGPWADMAARNALGIKRHWNDKAENFNWKKSREVTFLQNWENVHAEWSMRWKDKVKGWWIDGCYNPEIRFPDNEKPNLSSFSTALRTGNPNAIVCFNRGVEIPITATKHDDYTPGEVTQALPECPGPFLEVEDIFVQYHILTYMGEYWCKGKPRFSAEFMREYTKYVIAKGGVITWDVPIAKDGAIPRIFIDHLKLIGQCG